MTRGRILVGLAVGTTMALVGTAQGAVTIGSGLTGPADEINPGCSVACTIVNTAVPTDAAPGGLKSPVNGTVTSWSFKASAFAGGSMALRILRPAGIPSFTGAGTSAPVTPNGTVPTQGPFVTSLPIKAGDFVGLNASAMQTPLIDTLSTEVFWNPQLTDGQTLAGTIPVSGKEVAVQAVVEPSSKVTFGAVKRNTRSGSAKVTINVPNPGTLAYGGKVTVFGPSSLVIGTSIQLTVKAKGKSKKKLDKNGKVKAPLKVTFTPTGGTSATASTKIKLQKKLQSQHGNR